MRKAWIGAVVGVVLLLTYSMSSMGHVIFASNADTELRYGDPAEVDMLQRPLDEIYESVMNSILEREIPGAVVIIGKDEMIVKHEAYGHALRYEDAQFTESDSPVPMTEDTIFDLASISKLFTTTAAMILYEDGVFELDDPVADHLPVFAENGKEDVTIEQLMTHTSGFTAWLPLESMADDREEAIHTVLTYPLANEPGTAYVYSDLNLITLGALVEHWSGVGLDEFVETHITEPLGMVDTMYNPPEHLHDRVAATSYTSSRGVIRGVVHDGNAYLLDGVAGHAGLFSTAYDLAIFAQMMLNKGVYNGNRILETETVELMTTNLTPEFPGNDHGLGWELNQSWFMGALSGPTTMGHTGFTGTSIVVNPELQTFAILLTNRVHPTDSTPSTNPIRQAIAGHAVDAIQSANTTMMLDSIHEYAKQGVIHSEAAHALTMHFNAVSHYEEQGEIKKVMKHLEGVKPLISDQFENFLMTENIHDTLIKRIDYLIENLANPDGVPPYEKQPVIGVLPRTIEVAPGEETQLSIHGLSPNGEVLEIDQTDVMWDLDNPIGEIVDGVFTATEEGEAVITATYRGAQAERQVFVAGNVVDGIRHGVHPTYTRVVVDLNKNTNYSIKEDGDNLVLRIPYASPGNDFDTEGTIAIYDSPILSAIHYEFVDHACLITMELEKGTTFSTPSFSNRIVIDINHD